jgi:hypothetical protein
MSDPFRPIEPAHLQSANREAFEDEREKFRKDNHDRIKKLLRPHEIQYTDRAGNTRTKSLGLNIIPPPAPQSPGQRKQVAVSPEYLEVLDENSNPPIHDFFDAPDPNDKLLSDLNKEVEVLAISDRAGHLSKNTPITGPEMGSLNEEDIISAMEGFIEEKCGPGNIHPHLKKKEA